MPNQRREGLKLLTAYIEEESIQALKKVAEKEGTDMSTLLREFVEQKIAVKKAAKTKKAKMK